MQRFGFRCVMQRKCVALSACLLTVMPIVLAACTTTKRAAQLVVDHHVGMARGAIDIITGEAEAREQRVAQLRAELETSRALLAAEQDPGRVLELLKQHAALQDALVAELLQTHGHHHGGHQHAQAETKQEQPAEGEGSNE